MAPSQLAQLKSALSTAGLARSSQSKNKSKRAGKAGLTQKDRDKKQNKLDQIRDQLNKFDVRETKVKHEILHANKKAAKGVVGTPSQSRQKAMDMRRETLLPERQLRQTGHTGTFVDRRFGEDNPHITPEERALERFTRTRESEGKRGGGKKGIYNLNDDEGDLGLGFGGDDDEEGGLLGSSRRGGFTLTHGGRAVDDLQGDDFVAQGLMDDDDELEDDFGHRKDGMETDGVAGQIDENMVGRDHFGGFGEDGDEDPDRKRTKAEVMAEVIAKSKSYKLARQQQKELDADLREELDEGLDELRELLGPGAADSRNNPRNRPPAVIPIADKETEEPAWPTKRKKPEQTTEDADYDQNLRALAFEARAKPKDRTKTEDEQVKEEAEQLKAAEEARLRRMRGEESPEEEEGEEGRSRRRRKGKDREQKLAGRAPEGDDLGDDYDRDGEFTGVHESGIGEGIRAKGEMVNLGEESEGEDDEDDEDEQEDDDDEQEDEGEDEDEDEDMDDLESSTEDDSEAQPLTTSKKIKGSAKVKKEIPFTFKCPETHDDFLDIMDGLAESDTETVVKRIRTLYHPSLGEGNKDRLQNFLGILLDHVLYLAGSPASTSMQTINDLFPHIIALVKLNVLSAAEFFKAKLDVMQKNLVKGLSRGPLDPTSRTFPGLPEILFLRLVGLVWSTSDFSHPVAAPAALLMGQYLSQARIRNLRDVASGLVLCSIFLQYEAFSKRMIPEVVNFLASSLLVLSPKAIAKSHVPGLIPCGDLTSSEGQERLRGVRLQKTKADITLGPTNLAQILLEDVESQQTKAEVFATTVELIRSSSSMYAELDAFVELYEPVVELLGVVGTSRLPKALQTPTKDVEDGLRRRIRFAKEARRPLQMQTHKPIPIPQFTPKFDADFSRDRKRDPDPERNEEKKVKALYKKERKGAIRELRKDNKFLAVERAKEQKTKDEAYEKRMRQVHGEIATNERAEEKAMEREKNRDQRRAGRK